ncbi:C4-dicarboxylate ABC transporter substrate-binding protein [Allopusillimonas soli]|uniref:TRAP transporter substrate-binding protein n=2 Tax=Allopusillimonas soli TaxID=659016 RepID=A0A853F745_9BURK|nr:TRAP transporter substrate-binding protein [Allopusillimonas soli]NYT35789.1 TRAP transporter substrate-binding protein [Allopusillimonas soli]TEA76165.1 C4-dicarboxylate ABC transporter substrate-binding protein [Allopusillimonas soli]
MRGSLQRNGTPAHGAAVGQARLATKLAGAMLCLAGLAMTPAAWAQEFDLTMSVITSPGDGYSILTQSVPDRVKKATNGRVRVTVSDSLVPPAQIATAIREGRVDMSAALHTYLAADEPRMGIFNLPGLINDVKEYKKVGDAFWFEDTRKIWKEKWDAILLANGVWCTQQLFSKEPIKKIEDFKGKRLRVHNPQTAEVVNALGGKPVPLPVPEIYPALERGVIDGLFTSTCVGNALEYWRLAKNVQNWSLGPLNGWAILANPDSWNKLPPDIQKAISGVMDEIQHEAFSRYDEFVGNAMKDMESHGVTFWVAPEDERNRLMQEKYIGPSYDAWYKRAEEVGFDGKAYIEHVRQVLGKSSGG